MEEEIKTSIIGGGEENLNSSSLIERELSPAILLDDTSWLLDRDYETYCDEATYDDPNSSIEGLTIGYMDNSNGRAYGFYPSFNLGKLTPNKFNISGCCNLFVAYVGWMFVMTGGYYMEYNNRIYNHGSTNIPDFNSRNGQTVQVKIVKK